MNDKIVDAEKLRAISDEMRGREQKLVLTNGCFDLLHVGHIRYLAAARALGDALAVAINGDDSVRLLKGPGRPLNCAADRAEILGALACVDYVVVFPEVRATRLLETIRPAVYVKGGDYTRETLDPEERAALESIGTEIRIVAFENGYSTSNLVENVKRTVGQ